MWERDCGNLEVRDLTCGTKTENTKHLKWDKLCTYQVGGSIVETGSRKIKCNYIEPLIIFKVVGPNQFLLMSLDGSIYPHLIEQSRLKAGTIWTTKGNVNNLADLRKALSTGLSIRAN